MAYKIQSEEELFGLVKELAHVLTNLRHWTSMWHDNYGAYYREKKKFWEDRADELIKKLDLMPQKNVKQVQIENKKDP